MTQLEISPERLRAFSDGVIAIIVTIMVLELKLPEHAGERGLVHGLLAPLAPKLGCYAISFLVVVTMWGNHYALMATVRHVTRTILWLNNHLLFWMSLIPFATGFLGDNPRLVDAHVVYAFVLTMSVVSFTLMRWHGVRQSRENPGRAATHLAVLKKSLLATALYALAMPLAYVSIWAPVAIFIAVPVMFFLPIFAHRGAA